jgi:hypothetical protein
MTIIKVLSLHPSDALVLAKIEKDCKLRHDIDAQIKGLAIAFNRAFA